MVETIEHLQNVRKIASRDCSIRLPPVPWGEDVPSPVEEETSDAPTCLPPATRRPRGWMKWFANATRRPEREPAAETPALDRQLDVHATLRVLPTQLDSSSLPNGVVELLIEDFEASTRQLFDIHDGKITLVEPGTAVPWASIAGPPTAWALALGPERNLTALELTGDERLARCVLAALLSCACSLHSEP